MILIRMMHSFGPCGHLYIGAKMKIVLTFTGTEFFYLSFYPIKVVVCHDISKLSVFSKCN